jgi:hypothetical protein
VDLKKVPNYKLLLKLFVFLMFILFFTSDIIEASPVIKELLGRHLITKEYDSILRAFFTTAKERGDLPYKFTINEQFDNDAINVYVLESDFKSKAIFLKSLKIPYENALRNLLAISPNIIVVGEDLLADILQTIFNNSFYFFQGIEQYKKTGDQNEMVKTWAMINFSRYNNIVNSLSHKELNSHPTKLMPLLGEEGFSVVLLYS